MKTTKIFSIAALLLLATACSSGKYIMSDEEIASKKYSIEGWDVMKDGVKVGTLTTMEWEVYKNRMTREISIKTSYTTDAEMQEIARFVHAKFPNDKIEVNQDNGNTFPSE